MGVSWVGGHQGGEGGGDVDCLCGCVYLILVGSTNARLAVLPSFTDHAVVVIGGDVGLVALPCTLLCI